jgi:hypothetical protein
METLDQNVSVTVKQVFDFTPAPEDILSWCITRKDEWMYEVGQDNAYETCNKLFNVTKFMTQENICYNIKPVNNLTISLRHVTQSQYYQFGIYGFELSSLLRDARQMNIISYTGDYPYISRDFSAFSLIASDNGPGKMTVNYFDIFSSDYNIEQLPAPHDTRCWNRPSELQFTCKYKCLLEKYSKIRKIHPNAIIPDPIDYKIISNSDMVDKEVRDFVSKTDKTCHTRCFFRPCRVEYSKTAVGAYYDSEIAMGFTMRSPTEPEVMSISESVMSFVEYFSFVTACLGTWFGVSFLHLNPFRYSRKESRNSIWEQRSAVRRGLNRRGHPFQPWRYGNAVESRSNQPKTMNHWLPRRGYNR